eukprot:6567430-Ditylum_brightwellii.AAC.1
MLETDEVIERRKIAEDKKVVREEFDKVYREWRKWAHGKDTLKNLFPKQVFNTFHQFDQFFGLSMPVVLKGTD